MSGGILRIAITAGEPSGIGPDLVVRTAQHAANYQRVVIGNERVLRDRAARLGLAIHIKPFRVAERAASGAGELALIPVSINTPVIAGKLDVANAPHVLQMLTIAADLAIRKLVDAVVTAPVHKGIINESGKAFSGHTEFFAQQAKCDDVVMLLANRTLRVALATTHLPLRDVPAALSIDLLKRTIGVLHNDLRQKYAIRNPHIIVLGLNPHAGEMGHLGREEVDIIEPALQQLRERGFVLTGPLPADTAFMPKYLQSADAYLAMYHDQGLPVLKYTGFGESINITLGLPYIRTSVDHGTALDLAGTAAVNTDSFSLALSEAVKMAGLQHG